MDEYDESVERRVLVGLSGASGAMYGGEPATRCFPLTSNSGKTSPKSINTTR